MAIRALIVDDHEIVRKGIVHILSEAPDMVVAGDVSNENEALSFIRNNEVDLVLLDISMPGRGGLEILKSIKSEKPVLPVLMLSVHPEDQYALRAIKAGASGYITKNCSPEELISAVYTVAGGRKYVTPTMAEKLATEITLPKSDLPHERLSDREYQFLIMVASGKTVKEIASELNLSVKTISTYRSRVLEKMDLKNNSELTHYAIRNGLTD